MNKNRTVTSKSVINKLAVSKLVISIMIKKFYDLEIWKEVHRLSIEIYKLTEKFPQHEKYSVTDQLRRSATSVSANIAEGFGIYHYKDKIRFYYQARGSVGEVQNFVFLAKDLEYVDAKMSEKLVLDYEQLAKRINAFIKSVGKLMTDD